jgi:hypothetical protein
MPSFSKILNLSRTLSHELPDVVFIGGVAVYLHLIHKTLKTIPLEASHDADFMISFSDYGILKDEEEITPTPRLAKHQMILDNVEFDVYVERLNRLVVPYDEVFARSAVIEQTRIACLEHLLVLKLEALKHRGHSSKGEKDRRDIAKIGLLLGRRTRKTLVQPYMRKDLTKLLLDVAKSSIFFDMCSRNAHTAKKAKTSFSSFVGDVT